MGGVGDGKHHPKAPQLSGYYRAKYFVDYVVRILRDTYGDDMLYKGGMTVTTTLNYKMQKEAERFATARTHASILGTMPSVRVEKAAD